MSDFRSEHHDSNDWRKQWFNGEAVGVRQDLPSAALPVTESYLQPRMCPPRPQAAGSGSVHPGLDRQLRAMIGAGGGGRVGPIDYHWL